MTGVVLTLTAGNGRKTVDLSGYLDAAGEERAQADAIAWIKGLRHALVDGVPMRRRFTCRGDSLWWFTELYLHKHQAILGLLRTIAALDALIARESPSSVRIEACDRLTACVAPARAAAQGIALTGSLRPRLPADLRLAALRARARWLQASALASRARPRERPVPARRGPAVAAFVHRAFWRHGQPPPAQATRAATPGGTSAAAPPPAASAHGSPEGSAEAYIGPVLDALERRLNPDELTYVTLGPAENFGARRWWHALTTGPGAMPSIERFAPVEALEGNRDVWARRRGDLRALGSSAALREAAVLRGCDCWPVIREELAGVALLQWPWSARAMDEAGAALDALRPASALTYAEAGGWGRALVLECRRRGIPAAGLQHGFIYRHWLNYLHEPDEMAADPERPADRGFPRPDAMLLFDAYARQHLARAGRFPEASLVVTGSPRLDALVAADRALTPARLQAARREAGAGSGPLVVVVTKAREAGRALPAFLDAAAGLPDVCVAIKTHPAETTAAYAALVAARPRVTVLPARAPLAPLLRASAAVVTVNSTVALDAAVLGIPALVIGLPNNLSPFVDAGAMAGADGDAIAPALRQILYDQDFRLQLEHQRAAFLSRFTIGSDGRAAGRSAGAVLDLARRQV